MLGANSGAELLARDELPGKVNYFVGSDPTRWRTHIPTYRKIVHHDVYPGIDLIYRLDGSAVEFDFQLASGADPAAIRLKVESSEPRGAKSARVRRTRDGDLVLALGNGQLQVQRPTAFQLIDGHAQPVPGDFAFVARDTLRFRVSHYDKRRALVIDPVLSYSTYLGGEANDGASAIAIDSSGNLYVTGFTQSANFPLLNPLANGGQLNAGSQDVFVTELAAGGASLVYSTYLGGSALDQATGIAVDTSGNAYVTGFTQSADFPVANPLPAPNNVLQGTQNAFVAEIAAGGSALLYSTYLGGSGSDQSNAVAVDAAGNAYVAGSTQSLNFPVLNGFQTAIAGGSDGFVSKIQAGGGALLYSTFLGGSSDDFVNALTLTSGSGVTLYVSGQTQSTGFPTTAGVLQPNCALDGSGNCIDAFVAAINPAASGLSSLVFSTFLGGTSADAANAIAANSSGIYVAGSTSSADFPLAQPEQPSYAGGSSDAFVAKLRSDGTGLLYSTFLGGTSSDAAMSLAIDLNGNAYISGATMSSNFPAFNMLPAPNNTFQGSAGNNDAFLTKLNNSGSTLIVSTFFGGTGNDVGNAVVVDTSGNAYIAGTTSSQDMRTANAFQMTNGGPSGTSDAFIAELTQLAQPVANLSLTSLNFGSQPVGTTSAAQNITFSNFGDAALNVSAITTVGDYQATGCSGSISAGGACVLSITFTPTTIRDRPGTVTISDNASGSPRVINLDGSGIAPAVSLSPSSLSFGSQNTGTTSSAQSVTLTNSGTSPLTVSAITVSSNYLQTNNCPASLAASTNCTIQVTFAPTTTGSLPGQLSISDNASGSPQSVILSGTGITPVVSLSATSLSFGAVNVGTTSVPLTIALTNSGSAAMTISSINASVPFALYSTTCGATLAVGAKCRVSVTFMPPGSGKLTGNISFVDNAPNNPQVVALSGTGVAAATLTPTSVTYLTQTVGATSFPKTLTLANNQSVTLNNLTISATGDFAVPSTTCGTSLAAKSKCNIDVTFTPTTTGTRTGNLQVSNDASNSPQVTTLTGTGAVGVTGDWTFVQAGYCAPEGTVSSCTIPLTSNLTAGNLYVFMAYLNSRLQDNTISSVSANGTLLVEPGCHGRLPGVAVAPTCAYILPATSGGGPPPITVTFTQTTPGAKSWVYMAEFHPNTSATNANMDNASAFYQPVAPTQIGPRFTSSASSDVSCQAIISSSNVPITGVSSPYDTNAYLPGTAEGFSCATSTAVPTWTPASSAAAIAMGFSIGVNPSGGYEQTFIDFEGGSDGAVPTPTTLFASTHGWLGGHWDTSHVKTMTYASAASHPLQNSTGRLVGDGVSYAAGAGTLGVQITGASPTIQSDYISYQWYGSNFTDMTVGAWYYTNLSATDKSHSDCFAIHGASNLFAAANCYGDGVTRYIGLETPYGNGSHIKITPNTWYWIQIKWHFDGVKTFTHTIEVFDTTGSLVGISSFGPFSATADYPAYVNIGKSNASTMTNGKIQYLDSIKISLVGDDPIGQ